MRVGITGHCPNRTKMNVERIFIELVNHQILFSVADAQVPIEFTPNKQVSLTAQFHPML
jgi:hypothetical protein